MVISIALKRNKMKLLRVSISKETNKLMQFHPISLRKINQSKQIKITN